MTRIHTHLRRYGILILALACIFFLTLWALNVLSSERDSSTFLWLLPNLGASPAREVAGAMIGGLVVGLVLIPIEFWMNNEEERRRSEDDSTASRMFVSMLRGLAALKADEVVDNNEEWKKVPPAVVEENLSEDLKTLFQEQDPVQVVQNGVFRNVAKRWAAQPASREDWSLWGSWKFLKDEEDQNPLNPRKATRSKKPGALLDTNHSEAVIEGVKLSFPAQLAYIRAHALLQALEKAGAILSNLLDNEKLDAIANATEGAVGVVVNIGYWDFSFASTSTTWAVQDLRSIRTEEFEGMSIEKLKERKALVLARYRYALDFLVEYQKMELVLLEEQLPKGLFEEDATPLQYPPVLQDEA